MNYWQGKLVRLRGVEPSDAEAFFRWNMDSETGRALDFLWPPVSLAQVRKQIEEVALEKFGGEKFTWVIEDGAGVPVGQITAHTCNPRDGTFSYGVSVAAEHRRKGYAAEAVLLVVKYYFEELRYQKVTAAVHGDNESSIALHEKLGFRREGTLRRMFYTHGRHYDQHYFGLTREDWESSPLRF